MSGPFPQYAKKASEKPATREHNKYTLDEDLTILKMIDDDEDLKDIADFSGRPLNSIRYRYKDKNRGILKPFLENNVQGVYQHHKVEVPKDLTDDVAKRIKSFQTSLGKTPAA